MSVLMALDTLGERLREARLEKGLTLEQVAERVGVRLNTIWCYEKGKFRPSEPVLRLCTQIYDKPMEWFFGKEESTESPTEPPPHPPQDPMEELLALVRDIHRILVEQSADGSTHSHETTP